MLINYYQQHKNSPLRVIATGYEFIRWCNFCLLSLFGCPLCRAVLCANEEDERFFSHHALVIVHAPIVAAEEFTFADAVDIFQLYVQISRIARALPYDLLLPAS